MAAPLACTFAIGCCETGLYTVASHAETAGEKRISSTRMSSELDGVSRTSTSTGNSPSGNLAGR